ncbi:hypothetical protein [Burkholderia cenocepacia]|uniref:hypothetical protein n=1 Tax=Burkholderia cenocepacia TaxID=95486 RepID=UPI000761A208|nr:hypothetical protein [Burkholderia cenocepacia]KWU17752.1 hypothetical protein AS149_13610 [Burkholderia cenocepacia]
MKTRNLHGIESLRALPTSQDWHESGLFGVVDGEGRLLEPTMSDTGYSARSKLFRELNTPWSRAEAQQYLMVQYKPGEALTKADDWHASGLFAVIDADGTVLFDTIADTGYSCRSRYTHEHHLVWGVATEKGFSVVPLLPAARLQTVKREAR